MGGIFSWILLNSSIHWDNWNRLIVLRFRNNITLVFSHNFLCHGVLPIRYMFCWLWYNLFLHSSYMFKLNKCFSINYGKRHTGETTYLSCMIKYLYSLKYPKYKTITFYPSAWWPNPLLKSPNCTTSSWPHANFNDILTKISGTNMTVCRVLE